MLPLVKFSGLTVRRFCVEGKQLAGGIPPEQIRLVERLIHESGMNQERISRKSGEAAKAFRASCSSDLPDRLTESTLSRMKTGSDLKKLRRRNLVLLHLTIEYINRPRRGEDAAPLHAVEAAEKFADTVLRAGGPITGQKERFFNPNDPRHDRTASLFGGYGISLLESAIGEGDASSYQKLAILQLLSGNTDDAHHWNNCTLDTASGALEVVKAENAAHAAFNSGRSYLFRGQGAVAEIYLALAADAGHADAAFLLGEALEALKRDKEAWRWFSTAKSNGHHEAGARLAALEKNQ